MIGRRVGWWLLRAWRPVRWVLAWLFGCARRPWAPLLIVVLLVGVAPAARARAPEVWWRVGLQAAFATWGGLPPCGMPRFVYDPAAVGSWAEVNGRAAGAFVREIGGADCDVVYGDWARGAEPGVLCSLIVHEVGHLWGRVHVDDPGDVMNPALTWWQGVPACRARLFSRSHTFRLGRGYYEVRDVYGLRGPARSQRLWPLDPSGDVV
jgi:hypothetical protein